MPFGLMVLLGALLCGMIQQAVADVSNAFRLNGSVGGYILTSFANQLQTVSNAFRLNGSVGGTNLSWQTRY